MFSKLQVRSSFGLNFGILTLAILARLALLRRFPVDRITACRLQAFAAMSAAAPKAVVVRN